MIPGSSVALTTTPLDDVGCDAERSGRSKSKVALLILAICGILVGVALLAPTSVGGKNEYLVTSGTSMLPTVRPGSVVVIRSQPDYRVGEIVAYRNPDLHAVVLHRIISIHGSHYVFKGDNNKFSDFFEPTKHDLIGKKVFYSHSVGQALMILRVPWIGASLCFAFVIWLFWGTSKSPESKHKR